MQRRTHIYVLFSLVVHCLVCIVIGRPIIVITFHIGNEETSFFRLNKKSTMELYRLNDICRRTQ